MYEPGFTNDAQRIAYLEMRVAELEGRAPRTWLMSDSFLKRAFAVLGHYMVASLLIAIPFYLLAFVLFVVLGLATGNGFSGS